MIAKAMTPQTEADLVTLCKNSDALSAPETKLRVLVIGMCIWLFRSPSEGRHPAARHARSGAGRYAGRVIVQDAVAKPVVICAAPRSTGSGVRAGFMKEGRFDDCKAAWKHIQDNMAGRPKFDEFFRELTLRSGVAQPRASRIASKHFELQPETLRVAVLSVIPLSEGMIPITESLERFYKTWGLCFGGRPEDATLLEKKEAIRH